MTNVKYAGCWLNEQTRILANRSQNRGCPEELLEGEESHGQIPVGWESWKISEKPAAFKLVVLPVSKLSQPPPASSALANRRYTQCSETAKFIAA